MSAGQADEIDRRDAAAAKSEMRNTKKKEVEQKRRQSHKQVIEKWTEMLHMG